MAFDTYWRSMYCDSLLDLAGYQKRSILKEFVSKDSKGGDAVFFDEISPNDAADVGAITALSADYRMDFETIGSPALADWLNIQTPHTDVTKQRTLCVPNKIEAGYTFRDIDEVAQGWGEESDVVRMLQQQIKVQEDTLILNSLYAATQTRGKDQANLSSVAFPSAQVVETTGTLDITDIMSVRQKFEENYVYDEPLYMAITPQMKTNLINTNGSTIQSKDFVDPKRYFETGELPDIYGVHLIVHPLVSSYAGGVGNGRAVCWTPSAIKYNQAKQLSVKMDEIPSQRFQIGLYLNEFVGTCRRDDKRVVRLDMASA